MTDSSKPPLGRRMKAHAPPPPQAPQPAPRHIFRNTVPDGGGTSGMDAKENILAPIVELELTLPEGRRVSVIEDGSKALMDLLVELCSRYHLNPALHTLELLSPEGHPLGFKPNALLGSLNVACVLIKEKVWEEKVARRPAPKVPEKTVRLMVNYHGSQKAVVRVNPLLPLQALIPVICNKCEFDPAHVLLLKDSISHHELPLDKSLAELGIKELYVHDQSLVFQPKMASAPVLNYSDSIRSSTTSLGRPEKKGFLGIFQFSRRRSKTETTSVDMDDCDDKINQNKGTQSNGLSSLSGVPTIEDRPSTLGQSQSVMNIPRMSPKAETKKRRAPAPPGGPTPGLEQTASFESYQMGLGSESQLRKRKAPAPPPTPTSITQDSDDTSAPVSPTPDSHTIETPDFHTKVGQSTSVTTVSTATVVIQTVKPAPLRAAVQPPPVCDATPKPSSPTPSSSTSDSLAVQDSSSEISHSLEDSDTDLDQAGSHCSSLTSSTASGSVRVQVTTKSSSSRMEESASSTAAYLDKEVPSDSSSRSETESALNLKLDEVENNRHSAIGNTDRQVPPKPRRSPAREPPQHVSSPLPACPSPTDSNPMDVEEAAPQSWLHSMQRSAASGQKAEASEAPEDETLSLGSSSSSSGGSSLPDQGYAASEGLAEGEDSGMVSSPSDTQPTSPDGSLSLDGSSGGRGEKLLRTVRDSSSDSDEGCATWGSIHRHDDISPQEQSVKLKKSYEDEVELTAMLHQTLADFEADLAVHEHIVSVKETSYAMSTDSNEVPVSVVDMDVPVTAIDEVLEDYERNTAEHEAKSLTRIEPAGSKGSDFSYSTKEPQNKNNNAYTAAVSKKKSSTNIKQLSQSEKQSKPVEKKSKSIKKEETTQVKERSIANSNGLKEDKPTFAVKSSVEMQKNDKNAEISPDPVKSNAQSFQQKKPDPPPASQRSVSAEKVEEMSRLYQINSSSSASHGKITHNVTSRFGMKTFTVFPPKPAVTHAATGESAVTLTPGAIKIDDQGNMVTAGISRKTVGGSPESEMKSYESSSLLGKAKAFWSSNERQEAAAAVTHSIGLTDKAKESTGSPTAVLETTWKTSSTEYLKTTPSTLPKPAERVQPKVVVIEEAKEPVKDVKVANEEWVEVESKISVSKNVQPPSNKPVLPPPLLPDLRRDLSFLKPSRRTSSQYVASAITKYAPKTSAKPSSIPKNPGYSLNTQTADFQRSGRSIQVNPRQSSLSSLADSKENVSTSTSNPPGPKRSMSYPDYVSDGHRDLGEVRRDKGGFENGFLSTRGSSDALETETAKSNHIQSNGLTQIKVTASNAGDKIVRVLPRSPSPVKSSGLHSPTKPPTAPKTLSQGQTSNSMDLTKPAPEPTPPAKTQPSVTVTDSGVTPGPQAVTVFGPIKKFKPVICRSVERETSLHSSLMEAIQTGGGRDRLKRISTSGSSNLKKETYVEEENERSALLAAIRAQSNSSKLKKTKSEAADELEKFRKESSGDERSAGSVSSPSFSSLTCTSPVFTPPPPPAPTAAPPPPPPPPPASPQAKPSAVAHPNANAPMNLASAREAMLEAIRSGSAAERLKKVAAPKKTLQVNGRLGTIQPTSSAVPEQ